VIDLVAQRHFDEALAACKRLLEEFPDVHDGLERSAIVYAAMGDHARAADFYRKTVEFVSHPDRIDDYETLHIYQQELQKQERLARLR
jgi:tetratricopeptide (TPR) repeat protein